MRLAHRREGGTLRLIAEGPAGWVDIAGATGDAGPRTLTALLANAASLARIEAALATAEPVEVSELGPPLDSPNRIFCVGRNYAEHRDELKSEVSAWPEVFLRFGTSITGPYDDVPRPSVSDSVDYEGELAVVIGRPGRHIPADAALGHVFGYTVANDVSVRDWQRRGGQWTSGKNFDRTLPIGPVIVTADELDPTDLALETRLNGETVQSARTSQMIFDLASQIEFISSWTELLPGDLIISGTPGGVGVARTPPLLLVDGDVVEVEIEGIGTIRNRIVDDALAPATARWRDLAKQPGDVQRR
ncbi:MAG TPA: fumarylacetoacetate hydrolase family protein [Solirubrobacteraceae bacterium]|nr:fumarylacetoacetate hydrolase family protein [Solirubrobacteraceae bacterium]